MKSNLFKLLVILTLITTSCKKQESINANETDEVEFVIVGNVKNGEGKKLGLYIPSRGIENPLITEIVDGKFEIKGGVSNPERAELKFVEDSTHSWMPSNYQEVFITSDTLNVEATIDKMNDQLFFTEFTYEDNGINSYYLTNQEKYWNAMGGIMIKNDSVWLDSLRTNVFPRVRNDLIDLNQNIYSQKKHEIIGLYYMRLMFENDLIFDLKELSEDEKKRLSSYFNEINGSLTESSDYAIVKRYLQKMNDPNPEREFRSFSLLDSKREERNLSEIVSKNKYTVLDFWWAGCVPCREFNQSGKEYYEGLKSRGIEIVSISIDNDLDTWKRASDNDGIEWINLYAGANSEAQLHYEVKSFPTTLIYDKNKQLIDFEFKEAKDLAKLK